MHVRMTLTAIRYLNVEEPPSTESTSLAAVSREFQRLDGSYQASQDKRRVIFIITVESRDTSLAPCKMACGMHAISISVEEENEHFSRV